MIRVVVTRRGRKALAYLLLAIIVSPFTVPSAASAQNQSGRLIVTVNALGKR